MDMLTTAFVRKTSIDVNDAFFAMPKSITSERH